MPLFYRQPKKVSLMFYWKLAYRLSPAWVATSRVLTIFLDEDSGYLFPFNDAAALANQIKKVIADTTEASHRANNLKQKILTQFSQAKMLDQTFSLYQK